MDSPPEYKVVNVERVNGTFVLVEFADGKAGLYPGTLLRAILPQAKILSDSNSDDE